MGIIAPIHKKEAKKMYEKMMEARVRGPKLHESQSRFRKGRSTQDRIFTIKQMVKKINPTFLRLERAIDKQA